MINLVDAVSVFLVVVGTVGGMYLLQTLHERINGWANARTGLKYSPKKDPPAEKQGSTLSWLVRANVVSQCTHDESECSNPLTPIPTCQVVCGMPEE